MATWRFRRDDVEKWVSQRLSNPAPKRKNTSISDLLTKENIIILENTEKKECLRTLIKCLAKCPEVTDETALERGIFHREELMSTGIGLGLGVPHVRLESVTDIVVAVAISKNPVVGYEALDSLPVHAIFMIAAGREQHAQHIKLLSSLSFLFKNDSFREKLIHVPDAEQALNLIVEQN